MTANTEAHSSGRLGSLMPILGQRFTDSPVSLTASKWFYHSISARSNVQRGARF